MQCKRAVGPTWGLTPKTCRWMYTVVIRPILSYGTVIWVRALNTASNINKLKRVQALALRIMTGALPSTPFESLDNITDIPGIANFLKGEAAKGAARLQSNGEWTGEKAPTGKGFIKAHTTINNDYITDLNLPKAERDLTKPTLTLHRDYVLIYPSEEEKDYYKSNFSSTIEHIPPDTISCYTDGSKTEHGTGYGYLIITNNNTNTITEYSAKIPDFCSVYQAELLAITAAAEEMKLVTNQDIIILSDSLSSLQTLNNKCMNSKTALNCHSALNCLAAHNTVKVQWIEAHRHWGNDRADDLAKKGTICDNPQKGLLPQSYIKHHINQKVRNRSITDWQQTVHTHTKLTFGSNSKTTNKDLQKLHNNRKSFRTAVQLITGHAGLNYHLHKMTLSDTKICPLCESADETVSHFLGQCPALARLRGEIFNTYYASISDIFENHSIAEIIKYAHKSKRLLLQEDRDQGGVT